MRKAGVLSLRFVAVLLAVAVIGEAQQAKKVPRIGYLSTANEATDSTRFESIRQALRELGYIEEQNIAIDHRYADGKLDRAAALATELVRLKVDIIVAGGSGSVRAAKRMRPRRFPSLWWASGPILSRQA